MSLVQLIVDRTHESGFEYTAEGYQYPPLGPRESDAANEYGMLVREKDPDYPTRIEALVR